jgi:SAM-dependent methyltransferase
MVVAELGAEGSDLIAPLREAVGAEGRAFAIQVPHQASSLAAHSCDRILLVNCWNAIPEPMAALREAARLLREGGRLVLIEWHANAECPEAPGERTAFHEMLRLLEKSTWDIHRHGNVGPHSYFFEAAVSDESVQS